MERKPRNQAGTSAKPFATDKKSSQDVSSKPRGGRHREPQASSHAKSEQVPPPRKLAPQRSKVLGDKRPRPRGEQQHPNCGGKEATRLTNDHLYQDETELGSDFFAGRKKQSFNHLLHFNSPREVRQGGGGSKLPKNVKTKYNKKHFIQANCQFIVNASGDYRQYMNNPDALVDWTLIEQINAQVQELPTCPICLYVPSPAKMTRCGHIYCWPCMLHYMAVSGDKKLNCPICHENIYKKDLKSVVLVYHPSFELNQTITFKLMKRARGSLVAYPIEQETNGFEGIFSVSDPQAKDVYSKLLLADKTDIMEIINREKQQLERQLAPDNPENCFIEEAIQLLLERESLVSSIKDTVRKGNQVRQFVEDEKVPADDYDEGAAQQPVKQFYFYQAKDGQHIYLHAINVNMLEHTYGSLKDAPTVLTGKIIEKEYSSITEELRNRLRYLQHMPVTCQFEVAEINLNTSIVSEDTIDFFKDQLVSRKKRRQKRIRDEKKREKRIVEEENRRLGKIPTENIQLESHLQFPEFGADRGARQNSMPDSSSTSSSTSDRTFDSSFSGSGSDSSSYAMMLSQAPASSSPRRHTRLINVTGAQASSPRMRTITSDSEAECEDYAQVPEISKNFGDFLPPTLQKSMDAAVELNTGEGGRSGKKKKNKKVLFATSMTYSRN